MPKYYKPILALLFSNVGLLLMAQPDLQIRSFTLNHTTRAAGEPVMANIIYENAGNQNITQSSAIGYYISNSNSIVNATWLGTTFNIPSSIVANSTVSGTLSFDIPVSLTAGSYYVFLVADYTNVIAESNENNNTSTGVAINVTPYNVDLEVRNLNITPKTINGAGAVQFEYEIANNGTTSAHKFEISINIADTNIATGQVSRSIFTYQQLSIAGQSFFSTSFTRNISFNGGNFYAFVKVDEGNKYIESNESNNITPYVQLTVVNNSSDMEIYDMSSFPVTTLGIGNTVGISHKIRNIGDTWIFDNFKIGYYLSADNSWDANDIKIGENTEPQFFFSTFGFTPASLPVSLFSTVTISGNATPGEYYIIAYADPEGKILESNRANNFLVSQKIRLTNDRPDLVINSLTFEVETDPFTGNSIRVFANIANEGTAIAAQPQVTFFLINTATQAKIELGTESLFGNILIGNVSSIQRTYFLPGSLTGSYLLEAVIDKDNLINELSKSNNSSTVSGVILSTNKLAYSKKLFTVIQHQEGFSRLQIKSECVNGKLTIWNMAASVLLDKNVTAGQIFTLSQLPKGVYFINVASDHAIQREKIIIY